jgi:CheY-like chemotaxis protein
MCYVGIKSLILEERLKTILIVDDDSITNFINKRLLEKMKIADEVKVVNNGAEGVKCLYDHCFMSNKSPELILLDINMPVMDGFEFLRTFHSINFKNKEDVKIAVLTTSSHTKDKEKIEQLGVKCFVNKPLTEEKVRSFLVGCNPVKI